MDKASFRKLLDKAFAQSLTAKEREDLTQQLADLKNKDLVDQLLEEKWKSFQLKGNVFPDEVGETMLQRILRADNKDTPVKKAAVYRFFRRPRLIAACVLIAIISSVVYVFMDGKGDEGLTLSQAIERSGIRPGTDKATVFLSDGRAIILEDSDGGVLASDHGTRIVNRGEGLVSYEVSEENRGHVVYNTIQTPKGGQYHIQLEDGTKIHLNAESTLRFPVQFPQGQRIVELLGEGYFEVAEDIGRPFLVKTPIQTIEVLGTAFNVNAYPGLNRVKTTLVEGRVEVCHQGSSTVELKPGEMAISKSHKSHVYVEECDLDQELAWHHGYFIFTNEHITHIMARIARWYDIDIVYEGEMDGVYLGGIFQRSKSIVQLLESFKATGLVDFSIKGRRVTVMRE